MGSWKRQAHLLHRWLGIVVGLLVLLWFGSGIVMMYVPYPALTEAERMEWLAPLDAGLIQVSAWDAWQAAARPGVPGALRLNSVAGRPAYHFLADGRWSSVWAALELGLGRQRRRVAGHRCGGGRRCAGCRAGRPGALVGAGRDRSMALRPPRRLPSAVPRRRRRSGGQRAVRIGPHGRTGARYHARRARLELGRFRHPLDLLGAAAPPCATMAASGDVDVGGRAVAGDTGHGAGHTAVAAAAALLGRQTVAV